MDIREYRAAAHLLAARFKTPESSLLAQVMAVLSRIPGVQAIRMNTGMATHGARKVRYGYPGMADVMVRRRKIKCAPWEVVWLELKSKDGRQSEAQAAFQQQAESWGDRYVLAKTVDEVLTALEVERV